MSRQLAFSGDINRCSYIIREKRASDRRRARVHCPGFVRTTNAHVTCCGQYSLLCPISSVVLRPVVDEKVVPPIQWQAPLRRDLLDDSNGVEGFLLPGGVIYRRGEACWWRKRAIRSCHVVNIPKWVVGTITTQTHQKHSWRRISRPWGFRKKKKSGSTVEFRSAKL